MLKKKTHEEKIFKLICYRDGEIAYEFELSKKKLIIGRSEASDIFLDDKHISHYHAFLVLDSEGGKIVDLDSENGVFLNDQRVERSFFGAGDSIKFGPLEFNVEESIIEREGAEALFSDQDAGQIEKIDESTVQQLPSALPPVPGLVVIDGEYCDIVFDEEDWTPLEHVPVLDENYSYDKYIDTVENDKEAIPLTRDQKFQSVEVIVLSRGSIISVDYLSLKKNVSYFASPSTRGKRNVHIPSLDLDQEERIPFLDIHNEEVELYQLDGHQCRYLDSNKAPLFTNTNKKQKIESADVFSYEYKTVQVMVRLSQSPPSLRVTPFFGRDREFQKQTSLIFGALISLFLLLLFIDTTVERPKKKMAVIYRKAIKAKKVSQNKSKATADKMNKDTGVKTNKQPKKDIKMAKKSPNKAKKKKTKKQTKVAKALPKAAPQKVTPKRPKIKAYEFKMKKSLSNLISSSKSLKPTKLNKNSKSATGKGSLAAVTSSNSQALNAKDSSAVGTLGQDFNGSYDNSTGSKGLASKSGVDTTYSDPKTVVLGSMDPELLRKILKEYLPQFRHCYQKELERNESAKGVIDMNFRIMPNGQVAKINIKGKGAGLGKQGANCMSKVLMLIDFPKPKGGGVVDVRQPLNFFSEQDSY